MVQRLTDTRTSLGDQRIAHQVKLASYRIKPQDQPDLFQQVNVELREDLGEDYREKIGFSSEGNFKSTYEFVVLARCVDRVCKRIKRSKRHQSIDHLKEDQGYIPVDLRSCRDSFLVRMTTLLALLRDGLEPTERLMLELLQAETPQDEIMRQLGLRRTKFFQLKKEVFGKIAELLLSED